MKSLSIHKIEDRLMRQIKKRASETGLSMNKTIKMLLREALGLSAAVQSEENTFDEFCGVWSEEEFTAFEQNMAEMNQIDPEDWK